jgi:hypothetical protein
MELAEAIVHVRPDRIVSVRENTLTLLMVYMMPPLIGTRLNHGGKNGPTPILESKPVLARALLYWTLIHDMGAAKRWKSWKKDLGSCPTR